MSTRAVIPMLVAASVAPTKIWVSGGLSGISQAAAAQPSATGTAMPIRVGLEPL